MATKKKRRARRVFTDEQKLAIVTEITPKRSPADVARKHGVRPSLLSAWRRQMDGRPRAPSRAGRPPAVYSLDQDSGAAVTNGHAAPEQLEPVFRLADHVPRAPDVQASLDQALADIERAGKTIQAIREAARKVFGLG